MEKLDTALLEDVKKYFEYQLETTPKTSHGWGGKEQMSLLWAGINNSRVIVEAALENPKKFHEMVKTLPKGGQLTQIYDTVKALREYCDSVECDKCEIKQKVHCSGDNVSLPFLWGENN